MASDNLKPNSTEEYQSWDVAPPEHIEHGDTRALIGNTTGHNHIWEARGDFLHCTAGNHGIPYNHINKIFTGKTDRRGLPVFEKRTIQKHTKRNGKVKLTYYEVDN